MDPLRHEILGTSPEGTVHSLENDSGVGKPSPDCFPTGISESHVLHIWWENVQIRILVLVTDLLLINVS